MDPRRLIQEIPTETLLAMAELLTNGRADPQFVRAAAMEIKRTADEQFGKQWSVHEAPPH